MAIIGTQIESHFSQRNYQSLGRGEFVWHWSFPDRVVHSFSQRLASIRFGGSDGRRDGFRFLLIVFALLGIAQRIALARGMDRG